MKTRHLLFVIASTGAIAAAANAQFSYTGFGPAQWGGTDAALGISGYTIEEFEDTTLVPNLNIGVNSANGNRPLSTTLPTTFNPFTDDLFGTAFITGAWSGPNVIINTRTNLSHSYSETGSWGDLLIQFDTPVSSVGFSLDQAENDITLFINGQFRGSLFGLASLTTSGDRNGYVRIDATGAELISSITLDNGGGDGWVIDHLAFVPSPGMVGTISLLSALGLRRRGR
ncbi:MAG TPA: hypothetical protein VG797_06150 [Phycisphaerales bacterium]|nr:hypothetical protein [Phycisphaerales bacterium]